MSARSTDLLALARDALAAAGEAEADVFVRARRRGVARFALSELDQHMALEEVEARVRVARARRVGELATTDLSRAGLARAFARAAELATSAPEVDGFDGFAPGATAPSLPRFDAATAAMDDASRAAVVARVLARVRGEGLHAAGVLETGAHAVAVASTRGAALAHDGTTAELRVWALEDAAGKGASGQGMHLARDVASLAVDRETEAAIRIAKDSRSPGRADAGTWDVVMEPPAVAELLEWLGMIAFGAPAIEEGTSPLAGRMGEPVTGAHVTITEEPLDASELGFADPFDREGTPRVSVPLVEGGVGRAALYDRVYAARARRRGHDVTSTGSALVPEFGAEGGVGPVALHLASGSAASVAELLGGLDRGLYVRRLNYVNGYVEPRRSMMTGLTRDGCFLVERGAIGRPVGNLRMTDSFLEMLARADAMTAARAAIASSWTQGGTLVVPAVRFRGVRFTSGSR